MFWNALNTAFMSSLNSNKGLGDYDKLQGEFLVFDILLPPHKHTQRSQETSAYKNYTRVLRGYLLKKENIGKGTNPKGYRCLTKNQLNKDGFVILTKTSGNERDLAIYVKEL